MTLEINIMMQPRGKSLIFSEYVNKVKAVISVISMLELFARE
jgi:hypothetical protein